jgi:hypothetical protein
MCSLENLNTVNPVLKGHIWDKKEVATSLTIYTPSGSAAPLGAALEVAL